MRIHLKINTGKVLIPFDHQHYLVGSIHKWLGDNNEHNKISLYSFSRLIGGKATKDGLLFERGASFFFSSFNLGLIKRLVFGIRNDPTMFNDIFVNEIIFEEDPDLSNKSFFLLGSPIFIKRYDNTGSKHILYNDSNANTCLSETLTSKLKIAEIEIEEFSIQFDKSYHGASVKKVTYKGIENKVSWCPVKIIASNEIKQFIWNVGLGNSTGIGFGAIK